MSSSSLLSRIDRGRLGKNQGLSMGLPKLESVIDGVTKETYTLVFSGTGTGKTTLALYAYIYKPLMENLDNDNFTIIYYSLEMSEDALLCKLLSLYIFETYGIELSTKEIFSKKKGFILPDEYYEIVKECMPWIDKICKHLIIYDKGLNSDILYASLMSEMEKRGTFSETDKKKIYTPKNEDEIVLVVIDHAGLMRPSHGRSLKEEIDLTSSYLVTFREKCKISPLVIMQANRQASAMDRRREGMSNLTLNDVKDTGNPCQDSNVVISIFNPHREKLNSYRGYDIGQLESNFRSITVLKDRDGEADVEIGCAFYGKIGMFVELPRPEEIYDYSKYSTPMWVNGDVEKELSDNTKETFNLTF